MRIKSPFLIASLMELSSCPISSAESTEPHYVSVRAPSEPDSSALTTWPIMGQSRASGWRPVATHCWLRSDGAELLDLGVDVHRLDPFKQKILRLAPNRKLRDGDEVRFPCVAVSDVDREEFPKAALAITSTQKDRQQRSVGLLPDGGDLSVVGTRAPVFVS